MVEDFNCILNHHGDSQKDNLSSIDNDKKIITHLRITLSSISKVISINAKILVV